MQDWRDLVWFGGPGNNAGHIASQPFEVGYLITVQTTEQDIGIAVIRGCTKDAADSSIEYCPMEPILRRWPWTALQTELMCAPICSHILVNVHTLSTFENMTEEHFNFLMQYGGFWWNLVRLLRPLKAPLTCQFSQNENATAPGNCAQNTTLIQPAKRCKDIPWSSNKNHVSVDGWHPTSKSKRQVTCPL